MKVLGFIHGKLKPRLGKVVVFTLAAVFFWKAGGPVLREYRGSFVAREFREMGIWGTYKHHFFRFFGHMDELAKLDHENDELTQKVGRLEKKVAVEQARHAERELASLTEYVSERLRDDAGSELAVALRTIQYEIPKNLSYAQLQALALAHFEKQDYEKSALVLHHLLTLKEEARFRTPENHLLGGISWFHLKNFHLALREFKEAMDAAGAESRAHRSALVWSALVQRKLGKAALSQATLLKLLELYPHSDEASMINGNRKPAHAAGAPSPSSPATESREEHSHE